MVYNPNKTLTEDNIIEILTTPFNYKTDTYLYKTEIIMNENDFRSLMDATYSLLKKYLVLEEGK